MLLPINFFCQCNVSKMQQWSYPTKVRLKRIGSWKSSWIVAHWWYRPMASLIWMSICKEGISDDPLAVLWLKCNFTASHYLPLVHKTLHHRGWEPISPRTHSSCSPVAVKTNTPFSYDLNEEPTYKFRKAAHLVLILHLAQHTKLRTV